MNWAWYRAGRVITRSIIFFTIRVKKLRPSAPARAGGYVLAVSHQGHLDPFLAGSFQDRPIVWMTRKEFFQYRLARWVIRKLNGFCVDRQGVPVSSIRHAIAQARDGQVVGICPEGGVARGTNACFRGGPIKRGACSVAIHAGVPVIPCLILGSSRLSRVEPWLPAKRAKLWVGYGEPIHAPADWKSTRATRKELSRRVEQSYVRIYEELVEQMGVDEWWVQ